MGGWLDYFKYKANISLTGVEFEADLGNNILLQDDLHQIKRVQILIIYSKPMYMQNVRNDANWFKMAKISLKQ